MASESTTKESQDGGKNMAPPCLFDRKKVQEGLAILDGLHNKIMNMAQENEMVKSSEQIKAAKYQKVMEQLQKYHLIACSKERQHKDEMRKLEANMLRLKLDTEDKLENRIRDKERFTTEVRLYKTEAEMAKEQLRKKIGENIKLEEKLKEAEKAIKIKSANETQNARKLNQVKAHMDELAAEMAQLSDNTAHLEECKNGVIRANRELHHKIAVGHKKVADMEKDMAELKSINRSLNTNLLRASRPKHEPGDEDHQRKKIEILECEISRLNAKLQEADSVEARLKSELELLAKRLDKCKK